MANELTSWVRPHSQKNLIRSSCMRTVIITDLTRFSNKEKVCTAAIDVKTGECLRPMPYLTSKNCEELDLQPGAIIQGEFTLIHSAQAPHVEDANYNSLKLQGAATSEDFRLILEQSLSDDISSGFEVNFAENQKYIPLDQKPDRSIITVAIDPSLIRIHEDQFKPGKIKLTFTDQSDHKYSYLSITDRGFFDYAIKHQNDGKLRDVQDFLSSQDEIYLRIGLSRSFTAPNGQTGYWLQVNGIYTFPDYHKEIRSYL